MTSRAQVAAFVADKLPSDRRATVNAAAAWLVSRGRGRQAEYLARDVARILAQGGYVSANVTTARPLRPAAADQVASFIKQATGARQLELNTKIDPSVIGGVLIETPDAQLDATVRTKLAKFVQGVANE